MFELFWGGGGIFTFISFLVFYILGILMKKLFHSHLLHMKWLLIANSALQASLAIYNLTSNVCWWNNIIMQHKESTISTLMASDFQYVYLKHNIDGFIIESYKNHKMQTEVISIPKSYNCTLSYISKWKLTIISREVRWNSNSNGGFSNATLGQYTCQLSFIRILSDYSYSDCLTNLLWIMF